MNTINEGGLIPKKIKYALSLCDYTQRDIARECNVKSTTVGAVIHGRSRSRKVENRIAAVTRLPLSELWPQWHGSQASARRRRPVSSAVAAKALCAVLG
ncbi:hypothetical protein [Dyella sp. 20L07]|uniref:hypothetical protein n=1 Tax=Dyella sp. 20L07 TaxID=3384240 RepID=UPI003D28B058